MYLAIQFSVLLAMMKLHLFFPSYLLAPDRINVALVGGIVGGAVALLVIVTVAIIIIVVVVVKSRHAARTNR